MNKLNQTKSNSKESMPNAGNFFFFFFIDKEIKCHTKKNKKNKAQKKFRPAFFRDGPFLDQD